MHDLLWAFCHLWVLFFSASTLHMLYFVESCSAHQLLNLCWNFYKVKKNQFVVLLVEQKTQKCIQCFSCWRELPLFTYILLCDSESAIGNTESVFASLLSVKYTIYLNKNSHSKISILKLIKCKIIPKYPYLNKLQYLKEFCHRLSHHWKHKEIPPAHYHLSNGESLECREQ